MNKPYGVGLIGAGPGVSALHVPTLARVTDDFRLVHVSDAGSGRAAELAALIGATASEGTDALLADPAVDVVAICSPPELHARQILAAVDAGAGAILCEKPIAGTHEDVDAVIDAVRAAGVVLVVGTNHVYDEAWGRAKRHLLASGGRVDSITVSLALPPNDRYHDVVGEAVGAREHVARPAPDWTNPHLAAAVVRSLILGLAIHDLPLVRDLAPVFERVVFARAVPPIGYAVGLVASGIPVSLNAVMLPDGADAKWTVRILTENDEVEVDFPPSFVHDGSATVRVRGPQGTESVYPRGGVDGYEAEWRALAETIAGDASAEYEETRADAHYAVALAEEAAAWILEGAAS